MVDDLEELEEMEGWQELSEQEQAELRTETIEYHHDPYGYFGHNWNDF